MEQGKSLAIDFRFPKKKFSGLAQFLPYGVIGNERVKFRSVICFRTKRELADICLW